MQTSTVRALGLRRVSAHVYELRRSETIGVSMRIVAGKGVAAARINEDCEICITRVHILSSDDPCCLPYVTIIRQ